jgi:molybdopterin-containing oxidoreductase family iron-sulfur binding subunit
MNEQRPQRFDLAEFRRRLAATDPNRPWTSLDEIIDEGMLEVWLGAEFPNAAEVTTGAGRREFLRLAGASLMLAGLTGCGELRSDLALPYVNQPEESIPGVPRLYATAVEFAGYAQPVLATCHDGRPTKLDGNSQHPANPGGGSDVFMQTAILQFYDPQRSHGPFRHGQPSTWTHFERELTSMRETWQARRGSGLRVLVGNTTSPTHSRQLRELLTQLPEARVHVHEPLCGRNRQRAMRLAYGRDVEMSHALENCDVIVSLDDDLLGPGPHQVCNAQGFARRRGDTALGQGRTRLYAAQSTPTLTGIAASARLSVDPSRFADVAAAIGMRLGIAGAHAPHLGDAERDWVEKAARELAAHPGRSLLTCGAHLAPAVQALACWVNEQLGNVGATVFYMEPIGYRPAEGADLAQLVQGIATGEVDTLVMLGCNPVYTAPGQMQFAEALRRVRVRIHAGLYRDETAAACDWHLPLCHCLEAWGDARAVDGTSTIIQPLVYPLYSARTLAQVLDMLHGEIDPAADAAVRGTWRDAFGSDFEGRWRQALHAGFVEGTASQGLSLRAAAPDASKLTNAQPGEGSIEVLFRPDPCVWDGRFSDVAWLQELPKPTTKITWDSPVAISPWLASDLGLANGDLLEVSVEGRSITGPASITPGQSARTVVLYFGYGRQHAGTVAQGIGYSAYAALPSNGALYANGTVRRVGGSRPLVTTQLHHRMDGFDFVRTVTAAKPAVASSDGPATLYPDWSEGDHAWGMVIDLDRCIGCNACIAACNVENNVPVVGKDQVAMGREMLWLRVDHYYTGDIENPRSSFQPVPCMHCEKAPCEMGCPVHATVHSAEGVNQMVYNRCIGTRTCSSYCPYKVRRFNWFDYRRFDEPSRAAHNPNVTVRSRGVMEKCSYCTQRIQAAHVAADKEGRRIREGEIVTACQQACPASAIVFGDLKNPQSAVSNQRRSPRNYALLEELGTRPRTTYLARWDDEGSS